MGQARSAIEVSDVRLNVDAGNRLIQSGPLEGTPAQYAYFVGGLIGQNEGPMQLRDILIQGSVRGSSAAGGILGSQYDHEDPVGVGLIERAAFHGSVVTAEHAGGIVGRRIFGKLDVKNSYARTSLQATAAAGGIVGSADAADLFFGNEPLLIQDTYFAGAINDSASVRGGIIGADPDPIVQIVSSYYDTNLLPMPTHERGTGALGDDMRTQQSLYAGWDFDTIWSLSSGQYPRLRSLRNIADTNNDGAITLQDLLSYLQYFFAGTPEADTNGDDSVSIVDLFIYLGAYFARGL